MTRREAMARLTAWFASRGWAPLPFQKTMWRHYLAGESGLLHTPTGSGKTLAMFGGPLLQALADPLPRATTGRKGKTVPALQVLWITPLRALASDTARALREPLDALG
ncbi:MAG: DEAD/DEAH box helicase, partial [Stenotrophomonas sp.]